VFRQGKGEGSESQTYVRGLRNRNGDLRNVQGCAGGACSEGLPRGRGSCDGKAGVNGNKECRGEYLKTRGGYDY